MHIPSHMHTHTPPIPHICHAQTHTLGKKVFRKQCWRSRGRAHWRNGFLIKGAETSRELLQLNVKKPTQLKREQKIKQTPQQSFAGGRWEDEKVFWILVIRELHSRRARRHPPLCQSSLEPKHWQQAPLERMESKENSDSLSVGRQKWYKHFGRHLGCFLQS